MSEDTKIQQVMSMVCCTHEEAKHYLLASDGDVLEAVVAHTTVPVISGTKYIPPTPVIDDGMTPEVREKIKEARVFSSLLTSSPRNDLRGSSAQQVAARQEQQQQDQQKEQQPEQLASDDASRRS